MVDDDEYVTREQTILKDYEAKSNQKVLLDGQNLVQQETMGLHDSIDDDDQINNFNSITDNVNDFNESYPKN